LDGQEKLTVNDMEIDFKAKAFFIGLSGYFNTAIFNKKDVFSDTHTYLISGP
jgi:hypothetical protein